VLPGALRDVGLTVHTLADVYGEQRSQEIEDTEWIAYAAKHDLVVLCKDDRIRRRPLERQAMQQGAVRVFCLTNANLTFDEQAERFVRHRFKIVQRSRSVGPYVYGVYENGLRKLWPLE
jgi:hypothetical protein